MSKPIVLPPSVLGRLVESTHWDGIRGTRGGGQGWEKVLTAEVFQLLDWLPRAQFLGNVLRRGVGAKATVLQLVDEVEGLNFQLNPGDYYLADQPPPGCQRAVPVQPDGIMTTPSVFCMVEAKRIKAGSFKREQLTREFLAVLRYARMASKTPLLLLVLPEGPTVRVRGLRAPILIRDEIVSHLDELLPCMDPDLAIPDDLASQIDAMVAYTTWDAIDIVASDAPANIHTGDPSVDAAVQRLALAIGVAIKWHGLHPQDAAPAR